MAELDDFEARFAAACRRYLDEAPTGFDAAEIARTVVRLPPARSLPWAPSLRTAPALAWPLLLAVLFGALAAGVLLVGSQLLPKLPAVVPPVLPAYVCPPGSTPDEPGPVDQARPSAYASSTLRAFDRRAGKVIVLLGAAGGPGAGVQTWTFDVCSNTWTRMHPDREPPWMLQNLVYNVDADLTIGVHYQGWVYPPVIGNAWAYDLEANTWTEHRVAPTDQLDFYDPVTGLVVAGDWLYDVETDTWTPARQAIAREGLGCGICAYDVSVDRVVQYALLEEDVRETWLLDPRTGAWSRSDAETPDCTMHMWMVPAIVYDEAAQRTVVTGDSNMCAYDATADRWEATLLRDPSGVRPKPTVYDAVNRRLLMFDSGIGDVVAFDLVTREWTVLLEARG